MPINPLLCCSNNDLQQGWLPARVTNSSWFVGVIPHFSTESPQSQASWDSCSTYLQLAKRTLEFGAVGIKLGSTFLSSTCPSFGKLKALSGEVLRQPIIRTLACWQRRSNLWCTVSFCRNGKLDFFLFLLCIFNVTEQGINGYGCQQSYLPASVSCPAGRSLCTWTPGSKGESFSCNYKDGK